MMMRLPYHPRVSPRSRVPRGAGLAVLGGIFALAGCLRISAPNQEPPAPAEPEPAPVVLETPSEPPDADEGPRALLREAEARFSRGEVERAVEAYETYLAFDVGGNGTPRALLGLALAHLLPDSPVDDRARADLLLDRLIDDHPRTLEALQARWIRETLDDLARARVVAEERERTIRQLNQTLEQLRQIDLNRRPGGGARPADTLPPPRPRPEG